MLLKKIKTRHIISVLLLGIIGLLLSSNRPYIYLISGFLFLLFLCDLRYIYERNFLHILKNHSAIKTGLTTEIEELKKDNTSLKTKIILLSEKISTYEMLYSISRILVKQIELDKLIKEIKVAVALLRPTIKSFEIYPIGVKTKEREANDENFQKFEIPIILKKEVLGIIEYGFARKDDSARFTDECKIIATQTAIALKRSNLYNLVLERSRLDGLTGLYLRRYFLQRVNENFLLSKRYNTFFSLLMIDIDHFKKINDTYGHPVGDEILKDVSQLIRSAVHPDVILCRYGGEEFAAFIGLAPVSEVQMLAENLRKTVEEHTFFRNLKITISLGIAYKHQAENTVGELIRKADESLYKAKRSGRNKVIEWR
ncbi:MAG: sensor domain-containing diguanylate cyclase [Elusimicrobia bacterium]|nr:sensor domain-containing diguanylate cyclase [Elusimicrobiota bacterium]